jgi:argininosuccinate lyase
MQNIAIDNGGKCLSKQYIDEHTLLEWMCEKGHTWDSAYKIVNQGGWCVQCLQKKKTKEDYLEDMKQVAIDKGGKCLSTKYIKSNSKLEFKCALEHYWLATPNKIKMGRWWRFRTN